MKFYTLINRNQTQELAVSNNDGQTLYPLTQFQLSFHDMNDLIANISTEQLTYLQQELQNSNKYSSLPIEKCQRGLRTSVHLVFYYLEVVLSA